MHGETLKFLVLISFRGQSYRRDMVWPKGNRSRNIPACSTASQQTALSGAPQWSEKCKI